MYVRTHWRRRLAAGRPRGVSPPIFRPQVDDFPPHPYSPITDTIFNHQPSPASSPNFQSSSPFQRFSFQDFRFYLMHLTSAKQLADIGRVEM